LQGDYLGGITNQVCEAKRLKTPKQCDESKLGQSTNVEKNRDVGHRKLFKIILAIHLLTMNNALDGSLE
jgi:hypothetical protein